MPSRSRSASHSLSTRSVATAALVAVGPDALATSPSPLATVAAAGSLEWAVPVVRVGAAVASLGVLLSLLAGVSRTTFAMAAERDLPGWFDAVHPRRRVPHRAEIGIGAAVIAIVAVADVRGAIGFSSFAVLLYYAIANASRVDARWFRAAVAEGALRCRLRRLRRPGIRTPGGQRCRGSGPPGGGFGRLPGPRAIRPAQWIVAGPRGMSRHNAELGSEPRVWTVRSQRADRTGLSRHGRRAAVTSPQC